jgi:ATP-dependent DNA helicase RecG
VSSLCSLWWKKKNVTDNNIENANVTDDVTDEREKNILEIIRKNNNITLSQLAKLLSVTKMTIVRDMEKLKNQGRIERIGKQKGGYWKIIK